MIHIIGGGTFSPVRNHLDLCARAFGTTAKALHKMFRHDHFMNMRGGIYNGPQLHLTKMADSDSTLIYNQDISDLIDELIAEPETRVIIMNAALCDVTGQIGNIPSGSHAPRLRTRRFNLANEPRTIELKVAEKLIGKIRKERKDIFVVGFKTTTGATPDEQYRIALDMLKRDSLNLVLANDTVTRHNMIVAPEETRYFETNDRNEVLQGLVDMVLSRKDNTFTRSTVIDGDLVDFQNNDLIPDNLRKVVNHLVKRGAYKPFRDSTAGHFAVRVDDNRCLTSRRKTNYTKPGGLDLVEVEYDGLTKVVARGAKPSVGGQSQRIVFDEHPDLDCIVHAHVPLRKDAPDIIPIAEQWKNECGSHQCGANTSRNLRAFGDIHAVMLDNHGPNIVFSKTTPAERVIEFIERNFDIEAKTGGLVV